MSDKGRLWLWLAVTLLPLLLFAACGISLLIDTLT